MDGIRDIRHNEQFPSHICNIDETFTLLNLSEGMSSNMIGSIVVTLPNRTSGI